MGYGQYGGRGRDSLGLLVDNSTARTYEQVQERVAERRRARLGRVAAEEPLSVAPTEIAVRQVIEIGAEAQHAGQMVTAQLVEAQTTQV